MDVTDLMVCTDCAMLIANGTVGNEDPEQDAAHAERMLAYLGPDNVRPGTLVSGSGPDEEFSRFPCEGCGNTDAGHRMPAAILTPTTERTAS